MEQCNKHVSICNSSIDAIRINWNLENSTLMSEKMRIEKYLVLNKNKFHKILSHKRNAT